MAGIARLLEQRHVRCSGGRAGCKLVLLLCPALLPDPQQAHRWGAELVPAGMQPDEQRGGGHGDWTCQRRPLPVHTARAGGRRGLLFLSPPPNPPGQRPRRAQQLVRAWSHQLFGPTRMEVWGSGGSRAGVRAGVLRHELLLLLLHRRDARHQQDRCSPRWRPRRTSAAQRVKLVSSCQVRVPPPRQVALRLGSSCLCQPDRHSDRNPNRLGRRQHPRRRSIRRLDQPSPGPVQLLLPTPGRHPCLPPPPRPQLDVGAACRASQRRLKLRRRLRSHSLLLVPARAALPHQQRGRAPLRPQPPPPGCSAPKALLARHLQHARNLTPPPLRRRAASWCPAPCPGLLLPSSALQRDVLALAASGDAAALPADRPLPAAGVQHHHLQHVSQLLRSPGSQPPPRQPRRAARQRVCLLRQRV
mmetsp:Transcript_11471/g.26207  ORF Transcript_11471/g.26207 Transcript_11471/m.26207 type:complete len:416 (+) Transcript_11471:2050-3297(+)